MSIMCAFYYAIHTNAPPSAAGSGLCIYTATAHFIRTYMSLPLPQYIAEKFCALASARIPSIFHFQTGAPASQPDPHKINTITVFRF